MMAYFSFIVNTHLHFKDNEKVKLKKIYFINDYPFYYSLAI